MSFLPSDYTVPSSSDKYMKFNPGENRFRILSKPITGMEYWKDVDGKRTPIRKKPGVEIKLSDLSTNEKTGELDMPKHFWAMVVFDYADEKVKVLEITQKSIQSYLTNLSRDEDWGDPVGTKGYDIVITREGEGFDTKYSVSPKPKKPLKEGIEEMFHTLDINLEALYEGLDPYISSKEEVSPDEIPF